MEKDTCVILEGEELSGTQDIALKILDEHDLDIIKLEGLYLNPEKLEELSEIDPEYIFIWTTGMNAGGRKEYRAQLKEKFQALDWIPHKVIFFDEDSVFAYQDISKKLKELGTKFYLIPFSGNSGFREI